jgi:hypothetical protein
MTDTKTDNLDQTVATLFDSVTAEEAKLMKGQFDLKTIGPVLTICMQFVGTMTNLSGIQKKQLVIAILKKICPNDAIDQLIPPMIDILVSVDDGKIKINPTISNWFCCCKKRTPVVTRTGTQSK